MLLFTTVDWFFKLIDFLILARIIVSWLPVSRNNQLIDLLYQLTEPILAPIRTLLQRSSFGRNSMFDFSPVIAILLLEFLRNIILNIIL